MSDAEMSKGTAVGHVTFGRGRVIVDEGDVVIVRFDSGIQSCPRSELRIVPDVTAETTAPMGPPLRTLARVLAVAIRSVNDTWGVFSNSRIDLLPHQLWVCRRVLEQWPTRWLVADDVGLGKTIEAGLILTPLLSSGRVRRLLVLTPASLVEQWQERLRQMFDIRMAKYTTEADTAKSDFWGTHPCVVASAQTLRSERDGRRDRLLEAEPWDLILVDEAHHVNYEEKSGATLTYDLLDKLQQRGRIQSMVFFSGTPHRGKDYGFLSLLRLLRPERFDPKRPMAEQLGLIRDVMIRNNKHLVTNMAGKRLFQPVQVETELYHYNAEEERFYNLLTEYIRTGRAYASQLRAAEQRTAMLVLIAMQKLASSSVAAIRRALSGRLTRIESAERRRAEGMEKMASIRERLSILSSDDPADADVRATLEEEMAELHADAPLGPQEIPAIEQLLAAAKAVQEETKIQRLIEIIEHRFQDRAVLLFTEYKATQALVMSALHARFGANCATFINGDGRIEGVLAVDGTPETLVLDRQEAARKFNQGEVRFLVSTEAAGEGIDLQRRCHTLIHVDLPWNPMRLHQRVGRLNRYGQRFPVEVVNLRNPDTVEGRIWECLNQKLQRITQAFNSAMDEPEDMLQLVLGMASSGEFDRIFSEARSVPKERLHDWFDARSATFGGRGAIEVVRELVGNAARFDFGAAAAELPKVDLPELLPFFKAMLVHHNKRYEERGAAIGFRTPDAWQKADFAVIDRYELRFLRAEPGDQENAPVCGVGHRVFDAALRDAEQFEDVLAVIPGLNEPVSVLAVRDAITTGSGLVRRLIFGVAGTAPRLTLLTDWEIIQLLNTCLRRPQSLAKLAPERPNALEGSAQKHLQEAQRWFDVERDRLHLPFKKPLTDALALLVPEAPVEQHRSAELGTSEARSKDSGQNQQTSEGSLESSAMMMDAWIDGGTAG